jgi:hypothetical protein
VKVAYHAERNAEGQLRKIAGGEREHRAGRNGERAVGGGRRADHVGSIGVGVIGGAEDLQLDVCGLASAGPVDGPLARVAATGVAASGGGLVMAGIAGIGMEAEKAGTSAPPGALTV